MTKRSHTSSLHISNVASLGSKLGSGNYYELLHQDFLSVLFHPLIAIEVLGAWGLEVQGSDIFWDKTKGIAIKGSSDQLRAVVATQDGCNNMRRFLDAYGGVDWIVSKIDSSVEGVSSYSQAFRDYIILTWSENVLFGRVVDYTATQLDEFIDKHFANVERGEAYPRYNLVSEHTAQTGHTNLFLKSIPTPQSNSSLVGGKSSVTSLEVNKSLRNEQASFTGVFARSKMRLKSLEVQQDINQSTILSHAIYNAGSTRPTSDVMETRADGTVTIFPPGPVDTAPTMMIGGEANVRIDNADRIVEGTIFRTYTREMMQISPTFNLPSSSFTPNPSWIPSLLQPLSALGDPYLLLGFIALAVTGTSDDLNKYSNVYNNLKVKVLDSDIVEKELFE